MKGQSTGAVVITLVVLIIVALGGWWYYSSTTPGPTASQEQQVRFVVASFGSQLKMVPLTAASSSVIVDAIDQYYTSYVSPSLLQQWEEAPTSSPGRLTSSPWPDHIDILSTVKNADGSYTVEGRVVEVTSVDIANDTNSDMYPVEIRLEEQGGTWVITSFRRTDA